MTAWEGWRDADEVDLLGLLDLERSAGTVAHATIFPADRFPFPAEDVLARWRIVLEDPGVGVRVLDANADAGADADAGAADPGLVALVAWDATSLRHLAVHPDRWRTGLATIAVEGVCAQLRRDGVADAYLWVLEANSGARRLYERLGWAPTGEQQVSPWPPHPTELRYRRVLDDGDMTMSSHQPERPR